jgi:hypothetical protein
MKINDLLKENNITEAPLGAWDTTKNVIRSVLPGKSGRGVAQGNLQAGDVANKLYQEFYRTMASVGKAEDFTADDIEQFLQSKSYPTAKAMDVLKNASGGAGPSPAANTTNTSTNATTTTPPAANTTTPPAGNNRIEPTLDPVEPTTAQPNNAAEPDAGNSNAGAQAFDKMAAGLDQIASKPEVTTSAPGTKGGLGPQGRDTLARLGKKKQDRDNPGQGSLPLGEAIDKNIVAKAFSAAAQENNALILAQKQSKNLPHYFPQNGQQGTQPAASGAPTSTSAGAPKSNSSVTPDVIKDILARISALEKKP